MWTTQDKLARDKRRAYLTGEKAKKASHAAVVAEMQERLSKVPYTGARGTITKWRKAAIAAGYPRCEECTMPIARSHWARSITLCPTCKGLLGGYFRYKTMETEEVEDYC